MNELVAEDAVAVTEKKAGRGIPGKGFSNLLSRPGCGRMLGDVEVEKTPSVMSEDDDDEQDSEARSWYGEEVTAELTKRIRMRRTGRARG